MQHLSSCALRHRRRGFARGIHAERECAPASIGHSLAARVATRHRRHACAFRSHRLSVQHRRWRSPAFFLNQPLENIDWVIDVNLKAPLVGMRLVGDVMVKQGAGHIINVASLAGFRRHRGTRSTRRQRAVCETPPSRPQSNGASKALRSRSSRRIWWTRR